MIAKTAMVWLSQRRTAFRRTFSWQSVSSTGDHEKYAIFFTKWIMVFFYVNLKVASESFVSIVSWFIFLLIIIIFFFLVDHDWMKIFSRRDHPGWRSRILGKVGGFSGRWCKLRMISDVSIVRIAWLPLMTIPRNYRQLGSRKRTFYVPNLFRSMLNRAVDGAVEMRLWHHIIAQTIPLDVGYKPKKSMNASWQRINKISLVFG